MSMREYKLVRSKRKSLSVEVNKKLEVVVRAPYLLPKFTIESFVKSKEEWIENAILKMRAKLENAPIDLGADELKLLKKKAKEILPQKVEFYSSIMGLVPTAVKITSAKTRFGSCSGKNSICFSCRLMRYPEAAIDYVVVHELAHIKHKNHGKSFYALIEKYMPDYKERQKLLKSPQNIQ